MNREGIPTGKPLRFPDSGDFIFDLKNILKNRTALSVYLFSFLVWPSLRSTPTVPC